MPKFRKKPVEIEARRCDNHTSPDAIAVWCGGKVVPHPEKNFTGGPMVVLIETLEGTMRAEPGDWVIRGVHGEFYPCKPDIFEATYDAV